MRSSNQTTGRWLSSKREENGFIQKRTDVAGVLYESELGKANQRQNGGYYKTGSPKNVKKLKSFPGSIQHLSKFINNLSKKQTE